MSLTKNENDQPVHMPEGNFEFDSEVAKIFPDMARRAIPNYERMHRAHAELVIDYVQKHYDGYIVKIMDIGASHGEFASLLVNRFDNLGIKYDIHLVDASEEMCRHMEAKFKSYDGVTVHERELSKAFVQEHTGTVHVMVCHYIAQFIELLLRWQFIEDVGAMTQKGGLLLWGEKEHYAVPEDAHYETVVKSMETLYNQFRLDNGYSQEEIDAKTQALQNSMWPVPHRNTQVVLNQQGFGPAVETFRYAMFHSWAMVKTNGRTVKRK